MFKVDSITPVWIYSVFHDVFNKLCKRILEDISSKQVMH
jgi:hypothetical protein